MAKFLISIILACMAGACYIATGNSETIVCNNAGHECYLLQENSVTNSSRIVNRVRQKKDIYLHKDKPAVSFTVTDEEGSRTIGFGGKVYPNLVCTKDVTKVRTNNGTEERVKYLLTTNKSTNYRGGTLNEYSSQALCELDLQIVENYLKSEDTEPLRYKRPTTYLNFLWYIGTVVFGLLAILFLFAKQVSGSEAQQLKTLTDEQKQAVYNKVQGISNFISNFDADTAKKISEAAENFKKFDSGSNDK